MSLNIGLGYHHFDVLNKKVLQLCSYSEVLQHENEKSAVKEEPVIFSDFLCTLIFFPGLFASFNAFERI